MSQDDPFHLRRFLEAQAESYAGARRELAVGQKRSHWMWFIFPQIAGLGSSSMAQHYAIGDLAEARAYLQHPVLGARLTECTELVNQARKPVSSTFPYPDDLKLHSSMTLFAQAATALPNAFAEALTVHFNGQPDQGTLSRLR